MDIEIVVQGVKDDIKTLKKIKHPEIYILLGFFALCLNEDIYEVDLYLEVTWFYLNAS